MNTIFQKLLVFGLTFASTANAGVDGGGGAQIESAFRLRAYGLIAKIADNAQATQFCSATTLQNALDHAKIDIVRELLNPQTGRPITQILDAWTIPGDIQLLQRSWQNLVGTNASGNTSKSVDQLILHEVYRATGSCDDEQFKISDRVFGYLSGDPIGNYSEVFTFKYAYYSKHFRGNFGEEYAITPWMKTDTGNLWVCDLAPSVENFSAPAFSVWQLAGDQTYVNCFDGHYIYQNLEVAETGSYAEQCGSGGYETIWDSHYVSKVNISLSDDWQNQEKAVSPGHPLVLVHDIQNGSWSLALE